MSFATATFQCLLGDNVLLAAELASDVRSMWRRLARSQEIHTVAETLASDACRIEHLCEFVEALLRQPYDRSFRHPSESAICAALLILEQCSATRARYLVSRLRRAKEPSLVIVQRMAEYCDERFVDSVPFRQAIPCSEAVLPMSPPDEPVIRWTDPKTEKERLSFSLV